MSFFTGFMVRAQTDSVNINNNQTDCSDGFSKFGERIIKQFTWEGNRSVFVIYPSGGYSSRTGFEIGIMPVVSWENKSEHKRWKGHPNTLSSSFQISTKKMIEFSSDFEWFISKKWQIRSAFDLLKLNDKLWYPPFYNNDEGVDYESRRVGVSAELLHGIGNKLFLGGAIQLFDFSFKKWDEEPDASMVFGLEGGLVSGIGAIIFIDGRDHVYYPLDGYYFKCMAMSNTSALGSDYSFQNYLLDFRHYRSFRQKILASQFLLEYASGDVPFFMLPKLGGKERIRGIGHSQRVVDNSVWLLQSELRFPLWWRFGAVAFAGMGHSSGEPSVNIDNIICTGGAGFRFRILPNEPFNIRFDAAIASRGLNGFFISLKEAF